jgi:type III restriction enzyme
MDRTQFRPVEDAKIDCAMKLFNEISTDGVKYHYVDSYKTLIEEVMEKTL